MDKAQTAAIEASVQRGVDLVNRAIEDDFESRGEPQNTPAYIEGLLRQVMQLAHDLAPTDDDVRYLMESALSHVQQ